MDLSDKIGSLEAGKYADLVVLDQNLFEIEPHTVDKVKVLYTIMGGRLVYEAKGGHWSGRHTRMS